MQVGPKLPEESKLIQKITPPTTETRSPVGGESHPPTTDQPPVNDHVAVSSSTSETKSGGPDPTDKLVNQLIKSSPNSDVIILRNHLARGLSENKASEFKRKIDAEPQSAMKLTINPGPPPVEGNYTPKDALKKMAEQLEQCKDNPAARDQLLQHAQKLAEMLADGPGC